MVHLTKQ